MRTTMLVLFMVVAALWAVTALATVAVWRGVSRGERPNRDLAGAVAGLTACSSGLLVVGVLSQ